MKISVVIPVYNAEKTIERLLNSIRNQSYKNYEIIIINDGSTDKTLNVLEKYTSNNIKIINKKNEGVGKARKIGFQYVTGDLVFFCDSDDYIINDNVFEKIANTFDTKAIDILMFDALNISDNNQKIVNCFSKDFEPGIHDINEIDDCFLYGPLFLKIFKFSKLSGSDFIEFNNFEDTYTTYRYLNKCDNFYYINDTYYVYDETANANSLTKIKNIDKFIKTIDLICLMCSESKLNNSCSISAFNYYLYLVSLINKEKSWDKEKVKELKTKMIELEKIFLLNFDFIKNKQPQKQIQKYYYFKNNCISKNIIIVDGISTSGKSTISEKIYNILNLNNIDVKWIHEESYNPINLNLNLSKHEIIENQVLNNEMEKLIQRWEQFYNLIKNDNKLYILDSNFFKNIHDYLYLSDISEKEIQDYYNRIINIFEKDKIHFILLEREQVKSSFLNAFLNRGDFWTTHYKKHIIRKLLNNNQKSIVEEDIYKYEENYQKLISNLFEQFDIYKTKIVTDDENWDNYVQLILNDYNLNNWNEEIIECNQEKYLGNFSCENWNVEIFCNDHKLFLSAFWPNIELKYLGDDNFKLDKFPLYLKHYNDKILFSGELEWEMKDKYFIKNKCKVLKK